MKRALRLLVSIIIVILLGLGVFLLLHKSRHILLNVNRYFFLFPSFKAPLSLLLLECAILSFILLKKPGLRNLLRQRFNRKTVFFITAFFPVLIFLSTNRFLIRLFCISPIVFPLTVLFFLKYTDKLKKAVANVVVLFVAFLFLVVCIEVYLHIRRPPYLKLDSKIVGDFADFTSKGYLNEEVFDKKEGVFRILAFGDSFAVCLREDNKNYHDFLQDRIDALYGKGRVEIVNAGMESIGPGYYLHILERYGDLIKPEFLLVSFFVGNDFHEMHFTKNRIGRRISEPRDDKERILSYLRFKNFWIYQICRGAIMEIVEQRVKERELREGIVKQIAPFSKKAFLRIERERMWICEKGARRNLENFWKENSGVMLDIKEWCDKRNIGLVMAILPDQFQIEQNLRTEIFNKYNLRETSIDLAYPNEMLVGFFKECNIYCVDLLREFQAAGNFKELYLLRNTHWNEKGNRLAAEVIFGYLRKEIMLNGAEGGMPQG